MLVLKDFSVIPHIDNIYQIKPLKVWLEKHKKTKNKIYNILWNSGSYEPFEDGFIRLPDLCNPKQEEIFIEFYNEIEEIVNYHQSESNFTIRMNAYRKAKKSKDKLEEWFVKNEGIGSLCYASFLVDYLDYSDNPKHLILNVENIDGDKIFVDRECFKNTVDFLELISVYNAEQDKILKNKPPLPNKTYPIDIIKEKFILSCKECNPKLFYSYLQLDNVITSYKKDSFYAFFSSKVYCMKEKSIGNISLKITKDTDNNEIDIYQFYDESHISSRLMLFVKQEKDKITFIDISPL